MWMFYIQLQKMFFVFFQYKHIQYIQKAKKAKLHEKLSFKFHSYQIFTQLSNIRFSLTLRLEIELSHLKSYLNKGLTFWKLVLDTLYFIFKIKKHC